MKEGLWEWEKAARANKRCSVQHATENALGLLDQCRQQHSEQAAYGCTRRCCWSRFRPQVAFLLLALREATFSNRAMVQGSSSAWTQPGISRSSSGSGGAQPPSPSRRRRLATAE